MIDRKKLSEIVRLSARDLSLDYDTALVPDDEMVLKSWLSQQILRMMREDFNTLVNALYRIDVSETKVKALFNGQDEVLISRGLAQLIFERELEKIESRKKYKGGASE